MKKILRLQFNPKTNTILVGYPGLLYKTETYGAKADSEPAQVDDDFPKEEFYVKVVYDHKMEDLVIWDFIKQTYLEIGLPNFQEEFDPVTLKSIFGQLVQIYQQTGANKQYILDNLYAIYRTVDSSHTYTLEQLSEKDIWEGGQY